MRRAAVGLAVGALVAVALAGCGGGSDEPAGAAEVVRSDDGRAELTLPEGVDAEGIRVEAVELEGAAAYRLLPSGTSFDEPATLRVDVAAPDRGAPAFAILQSEDGTPEVVDGVETRYADGAEATIVVPVAHFSLTAIGFGEGADYKPLYIVGVGAPAAATAGVPFEVAVRLARTATTVKVPYEGGVGTLEVHSIRGSGAFSAVNATPDEARDLPARSALGETYAGATSFTCTDPGRTRLDYFFRVTYDATWTAGDSSTRHTSSGGVRLAEEVRCGRATTSPTSASSTTAEPRRDGESSRPIVTEIKVELVAPVTTYSVTAHTKGGVALLEYEWRMAGESCGTPKTPWTQVGDSARWSHGDVPPDSCTHATRDHAVSVSVTVGSESGERTTCTFEGSESRVITNPTCS